MKRNIQLSKKTILVTGAAGFIGANLVRQLLSMDLQGTVIGIDNMNDYYDVSLKEYRLQELEKVAWLSSSQWVFIHGNIADKALMGEVFARYKPSDRGKSGGAGRGAVFDHESGCLCRVESYRIL